MCVSDDLTCQRCAIRVWASWEGSTLDEGGTVGVNKVWPAPGTPLHKRYSSWLRIVYLSGKH